MHLVCVCVFVCVCVHLCEWIQVHTATVCMWKSENNLWCLPETVELAWPTCLERCVFIGFSGEESMAPEAQCIFLFPRDQCSPSGSEAFRPLCVSLSVSFVVKEA